jgi:uncharacterized protein (UPF0332 family)
MNRSLVLAEWKGAKAALQFQGISADSHAGVKRLFGQYLAKSGLIEAEWGGMLGQSSDVRLTADYDVETDFDEADAQEAYDRSKAFLYRIQAFLLAHGFTSEEVSIE